MDKFTNYPKQKKTKFIITALFDSIKRNEIIEKVLYFSLSNDIKWSFYSMDHVKCINFYFSQNNT